MGGQCSPPSLLSSLLVSIPLLFFAQFYIHAFVSSNGSSPKNGLGDPILSIPVHFLLSSLSLYCREKGGKMKGRRKEGRKEGRKGETIGPALLPV
ncbi:MAG: hypothetical protein JOS17DRAFT_749935 [Linnemannia elongata]|nr:MAG: hypothetical protein JOS17DRAFT_749935 [Linnemannia elongata]